MSGPARRVLCVLAYPLLTGGAVVFAAAGLGRGLPVWAIGVVVVAASVVLVELLERVIPYSVEWARPHGDQRTDVAHFLFSNRAFDVGTFAGVVVFAPLGTWVASHVGAPLWPHHAPILVQAVLALVIVELPWYWIHRLEHTTTWLWRIHSVHHSAPRMYWWNLARNHPLDNLGSAFASIAPLALLGVGEAPLAYMAAFSGAHAMLQHSNVDLATGPLDWVFTTARVHRFHHSRRLDESLANFGPTLTLWDFVFRSRRFSADAVPSEDVGLYEATCDTPAGAASYPSDYLGQLRAPFDSRLFRGGAPR